jgi:hypothetical protein
MYQLLGSAACTVETEISGTSRDRNIKAVINIAVKDFFIFIPSVFSPFFSLVYIARP